MGRRPGPLCIFQLGLDWIDSGTLARTRHLQPGPIGKNPSMTPQQKPGVTDEVDIPSHINKGLSSPSEKFMISLLGKPREDFSDDCQPVTNKGLASLIMKVDLSLFEAEGLSPALNSLKTILQQIRTFHPSVYSRLGTKGMLCCRKQRRSEKISNHSWGTAIDLTLSGKLDRLGNGKVQYGLALIAPIFNRNGWVWGAAFRREDGMHFEVSKETLLKWKACGVLPATVTAPVSPNKIMRGARGQEVSRVQRLLNQKGANLIVDGDFGALTEVEVRRFQQSHGINPDGGVGPETLTALQQTDGGLK